MKTLLILAMAMTSALFTGCLVHGRHGNTLLVPAVHVHSDECGHYSHKGSWHHSEGHRHGNGCGHHYRGGIWIIVD